MNEDTNLKAIHNTQLVTQFLDWLFSMNEDTRYSSRSRNIYFLNIKSYISVKKIV